MSKKKDDDFSPVKKLLPGAVGGAAGTLATMPIDVTKDVMKNWKTSPKGATAAQRAASKSFLKTMAQIHKERGLKGFYIGTTGSMMKIVPAMAITFAAGDIVKKQLEKQSSSHQLESTIFNSLPHAGRTMYDRALLGRIGDKQVSGEEKDIAKHVPYKKKQQYLGARVLTNPIATGLGAAGFALLYHKTRGPMLMKALKHYKNLKNTTHPVGKTLRNMLANQLRDPETGAILTHPKDIKELVSRTPMELRRSSATAGASTAVVTAVGRYLHPRALKGEAIAERERAHKKHPTEYIRTRLREDVQLKKGKGSI